MENNVSYRDIINKNDFFIATPVGTSMLPMIRERIDTVKLVKVARNLKKYDVILYERPGNVYVLHRIIKVIKKKGEIKYICCGDNQVFLEKYVENDQIIGVMEGYFRGESYIDINNLDYIRYAKRRVRIRIIRKIKYYIGSIIHKIFKKKK